MRTEVDLLATMLNDAFKSSTIISAIEEFKKCELMSAVRENKETWVNYAPINTFEFLSIHVLTGCAIYQKLLRE